jgi:putative transposase
MAKKIRYRKLSHSNYHCNYHIVWTPKYRYRVLIGFVADNLEEKIRAICEWKSVELIELNVQEDHVHLVCSIPPKISVSSFMGILKGKTAIKMFKSYPNLKKKLYWGNHFCSRGYFASTIGIDEDKVVRYVKYQERKDKRAETDNDEYTLF